MSVGLMLGWEDGTVDTEGWPDGCIVGPVDRLGPMDGRPDDIADTEG